MKVTVRPELDVLTPYKPGKPISYVMKEFNISNVIKLASNENPLGCSPKVKEALLEAIEELSLYPDGNSTELKIELAKKYGLSSEQVCVSSGSDEMVDLLSKTFLNQNDEVIMADITFPRYFSTATMMGATPIIIPLQDYKFDLASMEKAITENTKIIWICNPNNPTGTIIPTKDIINMLDRISPEILVVLDEAYREFVTSDDYMLDSETLLSKYENLVIMRTFSKAYGLAALRVGYTLAHPDIVQAINKIRGPFNVNTLAQVAAIAALHDPDFLQRSFDVNKEGKLYLYKEFERLNITYAPSEANHIFFLTEQDGFEVFDKLQRRGVIIRPMGKNYLRVSIGTMEENKKFIEELEAVL